MSTFELSIDQTSPSRDSVGDSVVVAASVEDEKEREGENKGEEKTQGTSNKNRKIMEGMTLSDWLECRDVTWDVAGDVVNDNAVDANADGEEVSLELLFWLSDIEELEICGVIPRKKIEHIKIKS